MQKILIDKANQLTIEIGFKERERVLTGSSFVVGLMSAFLSNSLCDLYYRDII